jgi:iron complex transport system substrate-binding protein
MKKRISIVLSVVMIFALLFTACGKNTSQEKNNGANKNNAKVTENSTKDKKDSEVKETGSEQKKENKVIKFTDAMGKEIVMDKPAEKIISLYSAHTENLFALALNEEIIGVSTSEKYPKEATEKQAYSYKDDPETIIAAQPDVVLIRTMIARGYPDFVKALENAGIKVVTLYVTDHKDFDEYITTLGLITGKEKAAEEKLKEFHADVDEIKEKASKVTEKKKVYFESIGKKFKTATPNSFAGTALKLIGCENIAADVEMPKKATTVVEYGEEKLLSKAKEIEVYVAQKGVMNKTVSVDEIKARPGYDKIKAVQNDNIVIIDEKIISAPNFRYVQGLKELQKAIYPELYK